MSVQISEVARSRKKIQMWVTVMMGRQHRRYRACADQRLAHLGVSSTLGWPLIMIGRHPVGIRHGKLSKELGIESPSLLRPVNQLINNGLVVREEDPTDKRAKILRLTEAGRDNSLRIEALLHELRDELFADLSDNELERFARFMECMGKRLDVHLSSLLTR
ncbi:MarR family winged helix-turn-helix transcriptional regulator [Rahnella contaminans]|uniref:MarR family winged helix-turn-helix transcriptional regulator n=1 Tax=Rahnella contaminans TaxID=2703882 RepID=UPI0023DA4612|nr:MarR family transcriptional regulator [Rahnella contaminans]MDF1897196.1 MarR family transcriptional regulator [Rahnella contaminans]